MKPWIATFACSLLASGCIVVADDPIQPGDPLDAAFSLSWSVELAPDGDPIDCQSIGADSVLVESTNELTNEVFVDIFDCRSESGTTQPLTAGDYYVDVYLADCDSSPDCSNPFLLSDTVSIGPFGVYDDRTRDLGHFAFWID